MKFSLSIVYLFRRSLSRLCPAPQWLARRRPRWSPPHFPVPPVGQRAACTSGLLGASVLTSSTLVLPLKEKSKKEEQKFLVTQNELDP